MWRFACGDVLFNSDLFLTFTHFLSNYVTTEVFALTLGKDFKSFFFLVWAKLFSLFEPNLDPWYWSCMKNRKHCNTICICVLCDSFMAIGHLPRQIWFWLIYKCRVPKSLVFIWACSYIRAFEEKCLYFGRIFLWFYSYFCDLGHILRVV